MNDGGFWAFLIVCVVFSGLYRLVKLKVTMRSGRTSQEDQALHQRLERVERRLANLEEIVVDKDKRRQFDDELAMSNSASQRKASL